MTNVKISGIGELILSICAIVVRCSNVVGNKGSSINYVMLEQDGRVSTGCNQAATMQGGNSGSAFYNRRHKMLQRSDRITRESLLANGRGDSPTTYTGESLVSCEQRPDFQKLDISDKNRRLPA